MASLVGKTLKNRYQVIESLGRGGMAEVYKVWDENRLTYLALKLLRDDLAQDVVFMRRFRREAQNLAQLQHPNIVRFFGLDEDDLKVFILMEYIEGLTLREEIRRAGSGGIELNRIQAVMADVFSALHYAHKKGVVHCDIKSGNILLDKSGKAYLTDFGIARTIDAATSTLIGVGTPAYMAPELVKGLDPTPQSDIYSLGIVLFEMLTGGERPFTGEYSNTTGTTADKVRWEQLNIEAPSVTKFNPDVSALMNSIVSNCLEKRSEKRYQNVLDLYKNLISVNDINKPSDIGGDGVNKDIRFASHEENNFPNASKQISNNHVKINDIDDKIINNGGVEESSRNLEEIESNVNSSRNNDISESEENEQNTILVILGIFVIVLIILPAIMRSL